MKLVSHNINGLNAYVKNNKLQKLMNEENADIYCFQEVKCSDEEKIKKLLGENILNEYNLYCSINTFKKGYAGVITLVRKNINILYGEAIEPEIEELSGYVGGRLITTEFNDFILLNLYNVNSGGEIKTNDRIIYDIYLISYIRLLQQIKPIILCGDLNVCLTENDYWGNYNKAIDSCPGLMSFEINAMTSNIVVNKLIDAFRCLHGDERKYSWFRNGRKNAKQQPWESRHGWRLDYFIISEALKDKIKDCDIREAWNKVDHSPIILEI